MNLILFFACVCSCIAFVYSAEDCGCDGEASANEPPKKDKNGLFEGDLILTPKQEEIYVSNKKSGFRNMIPLEQRWKDGVIPYYISDPSLNNLNIPAVLAKFSELIQARMPAPQCITFREKLPSDKNWIKVINGGGCYSSLGSTGGEQTLSLANPGCDSNHTIMHEFMHAIGFHHEQVRPDRDQFTTIHWQNIYKGMCYNFRKYGALPRYPYDIKSVMHYSSDAFSCNGEKTITAKDGTEEFGWSDVSWYDVLKIRDLYYC